MFKEHKDKILYGIIGGLIVTLLFTQKVVYTKIVDNEIRIGFNIFGNSKE